MTEWILSSSILILTIIVLRQIFRNKTHPGLQYALWSLVLLRLLLPISFGSTGLSVANLVNEADTFAVMETEGTQISQEAQLPQTVPDVPNLTNTPAPVSPAPSVNLKSFMPYVVWALGSLATAGIFLFSNSRFRKTLLSSRRLPDSHHGLTVFICGGTDTPCLFGLLHPSIYVTPDVAEDPTLLRHTLAHEYTHYRHGDHLWGLLRCLCLAVHWYNPLVWLAAVLSRQDGELACDEATIRSLGEHERIAYGHTLVSLTCAKKHNPLITATTMTSSGKHIKDRIQQIVNRPRMALYTLVLLLLAAAIAAGCTFTGGKGPLDPYAKLDESLLDYSYQLVRDRMEPEDVHIIGSVGDYHLIHCVGNGPVLTLYRTDMRGRKIHVTDFATGDYAISGGLSVNHIQDGEKHIYFGTVTDSHWIPGTDTRIPLDWTHLVFYDNEGTQSIYDLPDTTGFLFVLDSPVSDFWAVTSGGNVPLKMADYLSQGYPITEVSFRPMGNAEDTETISENARTVINTTMNTPNPDLFVLDAVAAIGSDQPSSQEEKDLQAQLQQQIEKNWETALGHCFSPGSFEPFRRSIIATQFFVESGFGLGDSQVLSMTLISRDDTMEVVQVEVQTGELLRTFLVTFRYNEDGLFYRVEMTQQS